MTYDNAIEYLRTSPLSNLSLSSKELFHSNFLYWLSKNEPDLFKELIFELSNKKTNLNNIEWDVKREFLNLDLSIIDSSNNNIIFVVENKVKSIPYKEQLVDYNKKILKVNEQNNLQCVKILLSLTKPTFNCAGEGWIWKSYDTVSQILKSQINNIEDQYHRSIINDYAGFAKSLHTLVDEWGKDTKFLRDTTQCEVAQDLRIHDLYGKLHTQKLEQELKNKLSSKIVSGANKLDINTSCSYQSSGPILEIKITGIGKVAASNHEAEAFVICVQGDQYRHGINAIEYTGNGNPQLPQNMCSLAQSNDSVKNSVKRIISKIGDWGFFMDPSQHPNDTNYACINKNNKHIVKSGIRNNFCAFDLANKTGINQIYQYKNIDKSATIDNILTQMVDDVQAINTRFSQKREHNPFIKEQY